MLKKIAFILALLLVPFVAIGQTLPTLPQAPTVSAAISGAPIPIQCRSTGTASASSLAYSSQVSSADALYCVVFDGSAAGNSNNCKDSQGNTWFTTVSANLGTDHDTLSVSCTIAGGTGTDTVEPVINGSAGTASFLICDVRNSNCQIDVSPASSNTLAANGCNSGAITTVTPNDLLIGVCGVPSQPSLTPGTGWSNALTAGNGAAVNLLGMNQVATSTGSYTATSGTFSSSSEQTGIIVAFLAGASIPIAAAPTFNPGSQAISAPTPVTITTTTTGAAICYTVDGSEPTATTPGTCSHGTTYSGAVTVTAPETLLALATKAGVTNSSVSSATYTSSSGVLWAGILAPARAVAWQNNNPGVVANPSIGVTVSGGIVSTNWTQCGSAIAAGASAATIQAAVNSCAAEHYVLLGAGTFNLGSGLNMKADVILRGSGPDQTQLVFTGSTACGGQYGQICWIDQYGYYYGGTQVAIGGTNSASWTAGYSSGTTSITLANVGSAGIQNGQFIYLDQQMDNPSNPGGSFPNGLLICDASGTSNSCSLEGGTPARKGSGVDRGPVQIVQVVSGCASTCTGAGPFSLTITPGLYGQKWASAYSPGAWWSSSTMQYSGLENLTVNSASMPTGTGACVNNVSCSAMYMNNAFNCWISNVRSISPNRNHTWQWQSAHNTIQRSYFFGAMNDTSQSYGVETFISSDILVINNIAQQVTSPFELGPTMGSVFVGNFSIDDVFSTPPAWMQQAFSWRHDAGVMYNLSELNLTSGHWADVFHGTGGLNTAFRNYDVGWETTKTESTVPVQEYSYNRFDNYIGNVLGCNNATSTYPGNCGSPYHNGAYQTSSGPGIARSIYDLGAGNNEGSSVVQPDSYVATSMMRWGNYDVFHAATQWNSAEVPSGLTDGYANSVPSSHTLPASFFFTSKPSWWGSAPWPPIGPDVTGGNVPGVAGTVNYNPAANCYFNTMSGPQDGSGGVLTFNATACGY